MPTLITHTVVGLAAGATISRHKQPLRFWLLAVVCAALPDADVIGFRLGIPYSHFFGHRGFFHSLTFALLVGLLVALLFFWNEKPFSRGWWLYCGFFTIVTASHGLLDALTNGGLGIALLAPFDNSRYFFPATPIAVSPLSVKTFISARGVAILQNELLWVMLPVCCTALLARLLSSLRILAGTEGGHG